jgi:predicted enzyme related to lactoylglutathione lyase
MTPHAPGTFCWFECGSTDAAKAKSFYTELFGWNAADVPMAGDMGKYTLLKNSHEEDIAGLYQLSGPQFEGIPSHWMTYVAVEDVDKTAKRAKLLGGKVLREPLDIPGVGRIAILQDPTGAWIAIARFDQHPGTSSRGPLGWSELATPDTARAQAFYTELFDWKAKSDPKNQYTEFQVGGRSIGGMMALQHHGSETPPHWLPYVLVEDCDRAARKATDLGARILVPATDISGVGRFAVFADPAGATLAIIRLTHSV